MDWFVLKNCEDEKITINADAIMKFEYKKDTDLTVIEYLRAGYNAEYVKGDITADLRRLLNAHGHYVSNIGV